MQEHNDIQNEERLSKMQAIRNDIAQNAQFNNAFIVMNALAAIIASYGLLADSVAGVIGAMLVAMLLGPIAGLALSLVDGDFSLFKQSSKSLLGGVGIVIFCALIIGFIHDDIPITNELLGRTNPNYLDLMIALAGGAVGAYAVITPGLPVAIIGVAIATALVPPLCAGTIFLARSNWDYAFGAYLLAITNIVAIQFSSSIVLWLSGFHNAINRFYSNNKVIWLNGISILLMIVLFVTLSANTRILVNKVIYETTVRNLLAEEFKNYPGAYVTDVRISPENDKSIIRVVVRSPTNFSAQDVARIESKLPVSSDNLPAELRLRHVKVSVMTKDGLIYDAEMSQLSTPNETELENLVSTHID